MTGEGQASEKPGWARQFAYLLAARWLRDGIQAVFLLLLARRSVDTYGYVMLAMGLGQILLFCSEFGINQHFLLQLAGRKPPSAMFRQVTLLKLALFAACSAGLAGFCLWQGYPPELFATALVIGLCFGLDAMVNSYYVVCQSLGRQDVEARLRGAAAALGYGAGIVALLAGAGQLAALLFKPLETLAALAGSARMMARSWRSSTRPTFSGLRSAWQGALPFTLMALAAILYNKLNMFFLQSHGGAQAVAQYSATWQLVDGIAVLASSVLLGNVLFPVFAKLWVRDQNSFARMAREHAARLTAAALPVTLVLAMESGRIIGLLYGAQYGEAARVQPLLSLCIPISFVHNLAYYLLLSMGRQRLVLWIFTGGLAVNAALCALLTPAAPLDGAVWAMVATKALVALCTVGLCQRMLGLFPVREAGLVLLAVAGAAALAWAGQAAGLALAGEILALGLLLLNLWRAVRNNRAEAAPC